MLIMVNTGHSSLENTQPVIARFLEIHGAQARSARSELDRLRSLIDDASERLMLSFGEIGEISARHIQREQMQDMACAVDNAVSALQFQDMANQLVGHAVQRIELLERIAGSLRRLPDVSVEELTDAVDGTACARPDGPVEQACMSGGSVDLF
jgi:DNA-binding transcriptional regulator YbjK